MTLSILCPSMRPFLDQVFFKQVQQYKYKRHVEFIMLNTLNTGHTTGEKQRMLLDMAQGEYVMFVADDDIISPRMLPLFLDALDGNVDGLGFFVRVIPSLSLPQPSAIGKGEEILRTQEGEYIQWAWHPICPTRKSLYEGIEWPDSSKGEDYELAKQMAPKVRAGNFPFMEQELYYAFSQEHLR
jgi:hypothetical protein